MIGIYGAVTPPNSVGGRDLVLVADGPAEDMALAGKLLGALTPLFKVTDPKGALTTPLTWSTVVQISNTFGPAFIKSPGLLDWIREETARRTSPNPTDLPEWLTFPPGLEPRHYQVDGAWEIARTGRAMIFDEPRTGKTLAALLGLRLFDNFQLGQSLPALVVCPASVVDPWVEAVETWFPEWRVVAWRGTKRADLAGTADIYVTSYDTATRDATSVNTPRGSNPLIKLDVASVIADEVHFIKNQGSARSKAVRRLVERAWRAHGRASAFIGLSGTPITHHPADLWPTLNCLTPAGQPSRERMVQRYCLSVRPDYGEEEILGLHPGTEPEFRTTILGQHRRVARADVMGELPPKVYSTRTVDLPAEWRKAYDDFEATMLAELPGTGDEPGNELSVMDTLSVMSHLSSLASSPADVRIEYGPDVYAEGHPDEGQPKRHVHLDLKKPHHGWGWKVDALLEILSEREGEPVVVYTPSKQLVEIAGRAAAAEGHRVGYIVGGQSQKVRTENRVGFQQGNLDVICATTGAGGTGITLSRAETLVFLQRPWALVESIQAEDRAEGDLNAIRGTEVIDVIARNTIESRVRAVLRERAGQLADLVQDPRIVRELLGGSAVTELLRREAS